MEVRALAADMLGKFDAFMNLSDDLKVEFTNAEALSIFVGGDPGMLPVLLISWSAGLIIVMSEDAFSWQAYTNIFTEHEFVKRYPQLST